jgi:hypothetical protein
MPAKKKTSKTCARCGQHKVRAEFYEGKGGISAWCRPCYADYRRTPEGHASILKAAKTYRESPAGKEKRRAYINAVGAKYRFKYTAEGKVKARYLAWYYLEPQPCKVCGDKAQAHHHDYSKPLEVEWLCQKHHGLEHRKYG